MDEDSDTDLEAEVSQVSRRSQPSHANLSSPSSVHRRLRHALRVTAYALIDLMHEARLQQVRASSLPSAGMSPPRPRALGVCDRL